MNRYKVDKKKFIIACTAALKNLEQEMKDAEERGFIAADNDLKARTRRVTATLKYCQMEFISEVFVTDEFLAMLNYCLTNTQK